MFKKILGNFNSFPYNMSKNQKIFDIDTYFNFLKHNF